MPEQEPLWNAKQLADFLGCAEITVIRSASQRPDRLPPRVRGMHLLRWAPEIVKRWVEDQSQRGETARRGRKRGVR